MHQATPMRPASRYLRRRCRVLFLAAPVAVLAGCTTLATRQDEYRQRKVALDPMPKGGATPLAGVGAGDE